MPCSVWSVCPNASHQFIPHIEQILAINYEISNLNGTNIDNQLRSIKFNSQVNHFNFIEIKIIQYSIKIFQNEFFYFIIKRFFIKSLFFFATEFAMRFCLSTSNLNIECR